MDAKEKGDSGHVDPQSQTLSLPISLSSAVPPHIEACGGFLSRGKHVGHHPKASTGGSMPRAPLALHSEQPSK